MIVRNNTFRFGPVYCQRERPSSGDPACGDVTRSVKISVSHPTTGNTGELVLFSFAERTTTMANLTRILGINKLHSDAEALSLVRSEGLELAEGPSVDHSIQVLVPNLFALSDITKLLEPNSPEPSVTSDLDNLLAFVVIYPVNNAGLLARQPFQDVLSAFRAFTLQGSPSSPELIFSSRSQIPGKYISRSRVGVSDAEIDADCGAIDFGLIFVFDTDVDVPFVFLANHSGSRGVFPPERVSLVLSDLNRNMDALYNSRDRNSPVFLSIVKNYRVVVNASWGKFDRFIWLKFSLGLLMFFFASFKSARYAPYGSNYQIRGKIGNTSDGVVT